MQLATGGRLAPTSHGELRSQLAETRNQLDEVLRERASLALDAINGNKTAQARIADLDRERAILASHQETIEQAMVALKHAVGDEQHHRRLEQFERALPRTAVRLGAAITGAAAQLVHQINVLLRAQEINQATRVWQGDLKNANSSYAAAQLDPPQAVLKRVIREQAINFVYVSDVHYRPRDPDDKAGQRRQQEAVKLQNEMLDRLIAATEVKPSTALVEVHTALIDAVKPPETPQRSARR